MFRDYTKKILIRNINIQLRLLTYLLMPKRRSKDQIITQILTTCLEECVNKTKIVYQANLNFRTVVPYLDQLIANGLLEANADKYPLYRTTAKGENALKSLREIDAIYSPRPIS